MSVPPEIPTATYRLQFNRSFTFLDAAALVPYLASLGISHCYASPYFRARPGSLHGYDIIDHNSLNPEIGSREDYEHFVAELHRHGMGQVLDIVPNHMGVMGSDNAWWLDVLENGQASQFADFFDIDWEPIKDELQGKILVPVLGDQYGNILENGELRLTFDAERGEFSIFYCQHRFPIDPGEYPRILLSRLERLKEDLQEMHEDLLELQSIATAFGHLPPRPGLSQEQKMERMREKEVQKRRLNALVVRSFPIREYIEESVKELNGVVGDAKSFDGLHELIKAQAYRLAYWRVAADDINYRRFFDINDLAALRQEEEQVFTATHDFVFKLLQEGKVNGLRIDHPDGLYDPGKYLGQLQEGTPASGLAAQGSRAQPLYVIIEKILTNKEQLKETWPVKGTTGYDFVNLVNGLFIDQSAATKMGRNYRAFVGQPIDFTDLAYRSKKLVLEISLASELNMLANALSRIALSRRNTCDFTLNSLTRALAEIIANFPVYRTYISSEQVSAEDREYIEQAVSASRKKSKAADLSIFDFIGRMLLIETDGDPSKWYRQAILRFVMKFQQVTSAVMAKGLEDTAFYRYHRLLSLNEVGGNPIRFGTSLAEFHQANQQRLQHWPDSMLSTSTHDSKRSEDVRARIDVLSEIPALFRLNASQWRKLNRGRKRTIDGQLAPSRNDEYLLYQTLIGAWPLQPLDSADWKKFSQRIENYMLKAIREAKEFTSWANPNAAYENATVNFVRAILDRNSKSAFLRQFPTFQSLISRIGMLNSLSQTLLKLTSPGVPDIYQGNELWDFSLVDPDNRRPVDYARRREILNSLRKSADAMAGDGSQFCRELLEQMHRDDGRIKMFLTWKTLCFRKSYRELFRESNYVPLSAHGAHADKICAFARIRGKQVAVVIAPRLWGSLLGETEYRPGIEIWQDTAIQLPEISGLQYRNIFSKEMMIGVGDGEMRLSEVLKDFPVALLAGEAVG